MRENISLAGKNWTVREISKDQFLAKTKLFNSASMSKLRIPDSIPAQIPGNVRLDLLNAGIIEDPFYGKNNEKSQWVSECFWEYCTSFTLPDSMLGKEVFLKFNRTDYYASFFLEKKYLGGHVGMFSPSLFHITPYLESGRKKYEITVRLACSPPKRWRAVKCQMSYYWDFAPKMITIGIWDDVELFAVDRLRIDDYFLTSQINSFQHPFGQDVLLNLSLDVSNLSSEIQPSSNNFPINIKLNIPELSIHYEYQTNLHAGMNSIQFSLTIPEVELWYPNGAGNQKLYLISLEIYDIRTKQLLDQISGIKFGFRKIHMKFNPKTPIGNEKWTFVINNRPEFIRGTNWVPPDSLFGRIDPTIYKRLLQQAKDTHMNMFRVWGGGICEKKAFFTLCDELGIMVWNEFPFACSNYPNHSTFLNLVERECKSIVKQIRNHPSVIAYVGGNEWNPRFNKHLVARLKKAAQIDPSRTFYDVSPCKGDLHDWAVWHIKADFDAYRVGQRTKHNLFQFFSEFGLQSAPNRKTLESVIPSNELWPYGAYHTYHHGEKEKLYRYGKEVCALKDLDSFIYGTQVAQAEGMKFGIEYCRRNKPEMSGVLFWQFNEPWPAICWSVIDYYGDPKIAYEYLKEIYQPMLPICDYFLDQKTHTLNWDLFVVNDLHRECSNAKIAIVLQENDHVYDSREYILTIPKESSTKLNPISEKFKLPFKEGPPPVNLKIIITINSESGEELSHNTYYIYRYRESQKRPHFLNEFTAIMAWFTNEKFWFIYELGRILHINNL